MEKKNTTKSSPTKALGRLRKFALAYPDAREDHPWGESAFKVRGKTFVFAGVSEGALHIAVKLPRSREFALEYPFTKPTPYGLGKAGWVSASFAGKAVPPFDILEAWIDESFRAIAPAKLAALLPDGPSGAKPAKKTRPRKS